MPDQTIPSGWVHAKISDIAIKGMQRKPESSESFTYVDIGSIDRNLKRISAPQVIDGGEAPSRARKIIENGDVLVSLTRPNLNAVALVSQKYHKQIASTGFEVIKPVLVDSRYIFALVRSKEFVDQISGVVQGALYPAAKSSDVQNFEFLLPPLAEQKAIADKLDTLLAQVDNTKARLERIPQILKRFRQSVLAAAVSGQLTEEWRGTQDYRPFSLKLMKSDEACYYPGEWKISNLSDACKVVSGNAFKSHEFTDVGTVPAIKISNIQYGCFEQKNQQYLPASLLNTYQRFEVLPGDLLMALTRPITNDTLKICRYPVSEPKGLLNQRVAKFLFHHEEQKAFFELLFQSNYFKLQVYDKLSETLQPNLSPADLKQFLIALPPSEEQTEIVCRVDQLFARANRIEHQVNQALARVNNLTQSILAKAFRGELTERWRKDNPELISGENSAEALLARIKKERAAQQVAKTKQKTTQYKVKTGITTMRLFENAEITLSEILKELGGETDAHTLWKKSNLSIDDFYAKLKKEKIIVDDNESADPSLRKLRIKEQ